MTSDMRAAALAGDLAQLCELSSGVPSGAGYVMEPKADGIRLLAEVAEDGVHLFSRSGKTQYAGRLPHIEAELAGRFPAGTWLDGEAVALRVEGAKVFNDWGKASSAMSSHHGDPKAAQAITFMVFDLIAHGGHDARSLPYAKRRALLERIFENESFDALALTVTLEATQANHEKLVATGFEGSVLKSVAARYASGKRGKGWLKLKPQITTEAIVMGYKPGENGFTGLIGAIIFGQYDEHGTLVERGRCSGMDMRTRIEITKKQEEYRGRVIEFAHFGWMEEGYRSPQYKRWRDDKDAATVTIADQAAA